MHTHYPRGRLPAALHSGPFNTGLQCGPDLRISHVERNARSTEASWLDVCRFSVCENEGRLFSTLSPVFPILLVFSLYDIVPSLSRQDN